MRLTWKRTVGVGAVCVSVLVWWGATHHDAVVAQTRKQVMMTRIYTGPDGKTHAEEVEITLAGSNPLNEVSALFKVTGAEVHRQQPGWSQDWHPVGRRQLVITLSGHGEVELADGTKIAEVPGHILLAEDTTGQGHISRVIGKEERVSIQLPLADQ